MQTKVTSAVSGSVKITYELTSLDPSVIQAAKDTIDAKITTATWWQYSASDDSRWYKLLTNEVLQDMHLVVPMAGTDSWNITKILTVTVIAVVSIGILCGVSFAVYLFFKKRHKHSIVSMEPTPSQDMRTPMTPADNNAQNAMEMMATIHEEEDGGFPYTAPMNRKEENGTFVD